MSITATELKSNLGKYLMLAETEDIYITRNGKVVAQLSNPYQDRVNVAKSLFGVLSADMTLEEAREEASMRLGGKNGRSFYDERRVAETNWKHQKKK